MAADDRPVLITDVGDSPQDEFARRKRRYGLMMATRVVCVIAAFIVGSVFHNVWLALVCIAAAAVLPWAAVLIANDRLPKAERARMARARVEHAAHERALAARPAGGASHDRPAAATYRPAARPDGARPTSATTRPGAGGGGAVPTPTGTAPTSTGPTPNGSARVIDG